MTYAPDDSSVQLAERLGIISASCDVVATHQLSTSVHELVLGGPAKELAGVAGNDVMVRVTNHAGAFVRRRYSVRALDENLDQLTLWITTAHGGAGSSWAQRVRPGQLVDVIGPRGKITLDEHADWHLFVGDLSGMGAFYRMAQSIEAPGRAIFIIEVDAPDDALTAPMGEGLGLTGIFVDRMGRPQNDPSGLMSGLAAFEFPPDRGHAYLFGEFRVTRALQVALRDRGLTDEQISRKAFWRYGRANADHGEPDKSED